MSNFKNIKKQLIRVVCMIMLVLIQFDVCGYDLMRAFQMADKPVSDFVDASGTNVDNDDFISEWSNPVYRGVHPRNLIKAPLLEFFTFYFLFNQRELPLKERFAEYFQAKLSDQTYLRFCVFII